MCISTTHRHSIFCILPPHLLRLIAQNGAPKQRAAALNTLSTDNTFRALRATPSQAPGARRPARMVLEGRKQRTIYDTQNTQTLPGRVVRSEGGRRSQDVAVNEAYDGLGATFDFFWEVYGRNSIDDEGMPLNATVHFNEDYNNAFWDGQQMVFGDGDGELFNRFTIAIDVIGHELGHGVTEDEGPLVYFTQAGALNESMSDVFGSLVKQYLLKQTADQADWLIGAGLLTKKVKGVALRSMKAPGSAYDDPVLGKDPQPGHMNDFVQTFQDNGGVHINSGIPNRAFYFVATSLGGHAWEKAGRIWYETLRDPQLRPNAGFRRFARLTVANAVRLYGAGGEEQKAVVDGWHRVGIKLA
ncbi:MAG: M4 family metallopeptidase [Gammaproteobacteria bacterium]